MFVDYALNRFRMQLSLNAFMLFDSKETYVNRLYIATLLPISISLSMNFKGKLSVLYTANYILITFRLQQICVFRLYGYIHSLIAEKGK